jgi:hypothetical protein
LERFIGVLILPRVMGWAGGRFLAGSGSWRWKGIRVYFLKKILRVISPIAHPAKNNSGRVRYQGSSMILALDLLVVVGLEFTWAVRVEPWIEGSLG